jgi:hypothetical protein
VRPPLSPPGYGPRRALASRTPCLPDRGRASLRLWAAGVLPQGRHPHVRGAPLGREGRQVGHDGVLLWALLLPRAQAPQGCCGMGGAAWDRATACRRGWGPAPPAQEPLLRLGGLRPRVRACDRGQQVLDMVLPLLDTLVRVRRPAPAPVAHGSGVRLRRAHGAMAFTSPFSRDASSSCGPTDFGHTRLTGPVPSMLAANVLGTRGCTCFKPISVHQGRSGGIDGVPTRLTTAYATRQTHHR